MGERHKKHAKYGFMLGIVSIALVGLIVFVITNGSRAPAETITGQPLPSEAAPQNRLAAKAFDGRFAGFSIKPPAGWTVDRNVPTIHVNFINPQPDADSFGPFKANMNVATQVAEGVSLDEFVRTTKADQESSLINYQEVTERQVSVGAVPGRIIEFTFLNNNRQLHSAQLMVIYGVNAYIVTGTTLDSAWSKYRMLFSESMLSLELKKI